MNARQGRRDGGRRNQGSGSRRGGSGGRRGSDLPRSRGSGRTGGVRRDHGGVTGGGGRSSSRGGSRPGQTKNKKGSAKGLGGGQIEGRQAVRELLLGGRRVRELWISSELIDDDSVSDLVALAQAERVPLTGVARRKLEAVARSEAPQGVIAFADDLEEAALETLMAPRDGEPPFLVAVDGVTDPGNLGAIMRCADAAGVSGVVLPRHRAVHVTPTVAKAAAGAVEHLRISVVGGLPTALRSMTDRGIWVIGLDDAADVELFALDRWADDGVCLVLGAEGSGLSRLVTQRCDVVASIPMAGRVSSLNVSAAAALAMYEIRRHRHHS